MTTYPWKQEPFHQFCVVFLQHYKHSASYTYNFGTFHLIAITLIYFFVLYIIFYFAQMHNHSISLYNSVRFVFKHSVPPPVCHSSFFLLFAAGDSADARVVVLFCLFACLFFPLCDCMMLSSPLSHSTAPLCRCLSPFCFVHSAVPSAMTHPTVWKTWIAVCVQRSTCFSSRLPHCPSCGLSRSCPPFCLCLWSTEP